MRLRKRVPTAVKFQSWTDTSLIAEEEYARNTEYSDKKKHFGSLREMVTAYQLTTDQHREAHAHCQDRGHCFLLDSFLVRKRSISSKSWTCHFFKIASMDMVHLPLLKYVARKQRPVVISTGMATLAEIEQAVETVRAEGNEQIVLLHCVSIYPPEYDTIHLRNMATLQASIRRAGRFQRPYSWAPLIPLAAIAIGRVHHRKAFHSRSRYGWMGPCHLGQSRANADDRHRGKKYFQMRSGEMDAVVSAAEMEKRKKFRRSLVARRKLERGHMLTEADLDAKRPGTGIAPNELTYVLGRRLVSDVAADQVLHWKHLQ